MSHLDRTFVIHLVKVELTWGITQTMTEALIKKSAGVAASGLLPAGNSRLGTSGKGFI